MEFLRNLKTISMTILKIRKIISSALIPKIKSSYYEILAPSDQKLWDGVENTISLGFELIFPKEYAAMVSSNTIPLQTFIIDSDCKRSVELIVRPKEKMFIKRGEPIAKLVMLKIELQEVKLKKEFEKSEIDE